MTEYDFEYCRKIAEVAHHGQTRKFGDSRPYMVHPLAVASRFTEPRMMCIAVLHDVIEDSPIDDAMLIRLGVPEDVVMVVISLSRREGETYREYIDRVLRDRDAVRVKIADVEHNMSTPEFGVNQDHDSLVKKRYTPTLKRLYEQMSEWSV